MTNWNDGPSLGHWSQQNDGTTDHRRARSYSTVGGPKEYGPSDHRRTKARRRSSRKQTIGGLRSATRRRATEPSTERGKGRTIDGSKMAGTNSPSKGQGHSTVGGPKEYGPSEAHRTTDGPRSVDAPARSRPSAGQSSYPSKGHRTTDGTRKGGPPTVQREGPSAAQFRLAAVILFLRLRHYSRSGNTPSVNTTLPDALPMNVIRPPQCQRTCATVKTHSFLSRVVELSGRILSPS